MGLLHDYTILLTDPQRFFEQHAGDWKTILKLAYAVLLPLALLQTVIQHLMVPEIAEASGGLMDVLGFSAAAALPFQLVVELITSSIGIPIGLAFGAGLYHLMVLILGGRGYQNTFTVSGAGALIAWPYATVALAVALTQTTLSGLLAFLIMAFALMHVIYVEVIGYKHHYDWGTGKAIVVSLVYPLVLIGILMIFGMLLLVLLFSLA